MTWTYMIKYARTWMVDLLLCSQERQQLNSEIRNSGNFCIPIVRIDANQLYSFSRCYEMPTGLYTRWELDKYSQNFKAGTNKSWTLENMVISYLQSQRPESFTETFYTTANQKKIDCYSVEGFCANCNTVFDSMGCFFNICPCQETRASLDSFSKKYKV